MLTLNKCSIYQVKSQHTERCIDFLTKELKVSNEKEAAERVFFVSARETLQVKYLFKVNITKYFDRFFSSTQIYTGSHRGV